MKLLVHACCAPCSIMPTRLLMEEGHDITVFYANSNIAPASEYERRLSELRKYAASQGFSLIEGAYNPASWERAVAPIGEAIKQYSPAFGEAFAMRHVGSAEVGSVSEADVSSKQGEAPNKGAPECGGLDLSSVETTDSVTSASMPATVAELLDDERRKERCRACYRLRLEEAARAAVEGGFEALTTTLAVSPYQFTDVIREEVERACAQAGLMSYFEDYRPYYDEATRISRELGMYRQNYCGCRFSVQEGEATRAFVKQQRKAQKAARKAEREGEESERRQRAVEKQAYAEAQARKRAILKSMRERNR